MKKAKFLMAIIFVLILLLFSPTIINLMISFIKIFNPYFDNYNLPIQEWLIFFGTVFGGFTTLLAFIFTIIYNNKNNNKMHVERITELSYQTGLNEIRETANTITKLIQSFNRIDKFRISSNFFSRAKIW